MPVIRPVDDRERSQYNGAVKHPIQTWEWGEFRQKTGVEIVRFGVFDQSSIVDGIQVSFHPIPKLPFTIGYFPKGSMPTTEQLEILRQIGQKKKAIAIKLEPNIAAPVESPHALEKIRQFLLDAGAVPGRPLFTKHTFILNLEETEEKLFAHLKPKTRYNIGVAQKRGVQIIEETTEQTLEEYLDLQRLTTKRQQFYAHSDAYFRDLFATLNPSGMIRIFKAVFENKTLAVWILLQHNQVLYYPYGASSREHRDTMANNLLMWEAILAGKRAGCRTFDMWGSLGPDPDSSDPWYGFHRFKAGYGAELREFVGTYDLVIQPPLYGIYRTAENLRWKFLRLKARFGL